MRKVSILVSLLVVFSVVLAACSPSNGTTETAIVTGSPASGTDLTETPVSGIPVTGQTDTPGAPVATDTTEATQAGTAAATSEATQPAAATPATMGSLDPGLLTNEMKFQVVDPQNQPLGQVKDFVLDFVNRKVAYVVVSLTAGTSGQTVAVPWNMLKIQDTSTLSSSASSSSTTSTPMANPPVGAPQDAFVYTGDASLLSNAPAFDTGSLPQFGVAAGSWDAALISYWSGTPAGASTATPAATAAVTDTPVPTTAASSTPVALQGVALASKVIGFGIMDATNPQFAKVSDVVVDTTTGAIKYFIVNVNDKLYIVPLDFLQLDMQNVAIVLSGGSQILQNAPSFAVGSFPLTTTMDWDAQIQTFWQNLMVQPTSTVSP